MPAGAPPPAAACAALATRPEVLLRAAAAGRAGSPLLSVATSGGWLVRPARAVKVLQAGPLSRCGEAAHVLANVTGSVRRVDALFAPLAQPAAASLARGVAVTPKATYFPIWW